MREGVACILARTGLWCAAGRFRCVNTGSPDGGAVLRSYGAFMWCTPAEGSGLLMPGIEGDRSAW